MLALLNSSLQVIATGLIVYGALEIQKANNEGGIILMAAGFIAYVIYEKFVPSTLK